MWSSAFCFFLRDFAWQGYIIVATEVALEATSMNVAVTARATNSEFAVQWMDAARAATAA